MSTIWTPSGEYVPREEPAKEAAPPPPPAAGAPGEGREPTPEEVQAALEQARAVLHMPVIEHIGGHAMALFELAESKPLLPALVPERSMACSMFSVVSTPKMMGTPVSSAARAIPAEAWLQT